MTSRKLAFAVTMACAWSPCYAASQDADVLEPIHHFFEAFAKQDKHGMLAAVAPNVSITSVQQGALRHMTMDHLADVIAKHQGGPIAEHIYDPVVHVDHDLAVVWAPYKFISNGKPHHCGTDVFTLAKLGGHWTIIGVSDNERKESCQ